MAGVADSYKNQIIPGAVMRLGRTSDAQVTGDWQIQHFRFYQQTSSVLGPGPRPLRHHSPWD